MLPYIKLKMLSYIKLKMLSYIDLKKIWKCCHILKYPYNRQHILVLKGAIFGTLFVDQEDQPFGRKEWSA